MMVGREKRTKMIIAHMVPFKGGGVDWLVGQLLRDLRKMGAHGKVILKSDQENAILDVLNDVCKQRWKENDSTVNRGVESKRWISIQWYRRESGTRSWRSPHAQVRPWDQTQNGTADWHPCNAWMVESEEDIINKFKVGQDGEQPMKDWNVQRCDPWIRERHSPPYPGKNLKGYWCWKNGCKTCGLGKDLAPTSTWLVLREVKWWGRGMSDRRRLKILGNGRRSTRSKGQQWDPNAILTYERVVPRQISQDQRTDATWRKVRFYVKVVYDYKKRICQRQEDGRKVAGECKTMKEGDLSRTNLAHSTECKASVAEILADDVGFQTKMRKTTERKEGERRPSEPIPIVHVGGSSSSGSAHVEPPAHSNSKEKDAVMDSADVEIPLADGARVTINTSSPLSKSETGTKRSRENDEEYEDNVATKLAATSRELAEGCAWTLTEKRSRMFEPVGEPTPWLLPNVVNRPNWALERKQAKINTRPPSSPHRGVDKDATDKLNCVHYRTEREVQHVYGHSAHWSVRRVFRVENLPESISGLIVVFRLSLCFVIVSRLNFATIFVWLKKKLCHPKYHLADHDFVLWWRINEIAPWMTVKSSVVQNCSWKISTILKSFLLSSSCHASVPLFPIPQMTKHKNDPGEDLLISRIQSLRLLLQEWPWPKGTIFFGTG